ncbi:MAG: hypothetical protein ACI8S6_004375 [Myxococcota bacterium]|jgi:hypothetical protein
MDENKPSQQAYIALVLSVLGCLGCGGCITGVIGAILGKTELDKISRGESSPAGAGVAKIAIVLGVVEVIIVGLILVLYAGVMFLGVGASMMEGGY